MRSTSMGKSIEGGGRGFAQQRRRSKVKIWIPIDPPSIASRNVISEGCAVCCRSGGISVFRLPRKASPGAADKERYSTASVTVKLF